MKEEEYALPPLCLLRPLAEGKVTPEMAGVFRMTDTLKSVLPQLLKEHKAIVAELESLAEAAKNEKRLEFARFAEKMILHAKTEEEVLYPATILIGEYLKQKLNPSSTLW